MTTLESAARPIVCVAAMECELVHLRAMFPGAREQIAGRRRAWVTALAGYPLVLACYGIGEMSAAAVAEALIQRLQPRAVLNFGCAGAHRTDLLPGDVVIGSRVVAYARVKVAPDGGEQPLKLHFLRDGEQRRTDGLDADPTLLAIAQRAAASLVELERWPLTAGWPASTPHRAPQIRAGVIASADTWNMAPARIEALVNQYDSLCEEMEAAAIALTCASHDIPFLAIKDISNNELLRATTGAFDVETEGQLGRRAAALIYAVAYALARDVVE